MTVRLLFPTHHLRTLLGLTDDIGPLDETRICRFSTTYQAL